MKPNNDEDPIVSIVQDAFQHQPIGRRPVVRVLEQPVVSEMHPSATNRLVKSALNTVWSIPVAIVLLLVSMLIWNSSPLSRREANVAEKSTAELRPADQRRDMDGDANQDQTESTPDSQTLAPVEQTDEVADSVGGVERGLADFDKLLSGNEQTINSNQSVDSDDALSSDLQVTEETLLMLGQLMAGATEIDSSLLAKRLTDLGFASSKEGLDELQTPATINLIGRDVSRALRWVADPGDRALALEFDVPSAIAGLKRFVNASVGEDLFDPLLNGIRDDPDGPQVDLRRDFFAQLRGSAVVAIRKSDASDTIQMVLALPCNNASTVSRVLDSAMKKETSTQRKKHAGNVVWEWKDRQNRFAVAVVKDCLLIGEREMALQAIERATP